jgi:hypothetical protein
MLPMAISIFVEQGNREHFIFVHIIGLHKPVLPEGSPNAYLLIFIDTTYRNHGSNG